MDAAWRKRVQQEHQECKKRNPQLMRRLAKLTDAQLNRVYAAVLELEPPSASRDWELRSLRELEAFRSAPKPKRGGKVSRLRPPAEKHRAPLHGTPPEPPTLGGLDLPARTPSASHPPAAPPHRSRRTSSCSPRNSLATGERRRSGSVVRSECLISSAS